jgi:hypothetical protein
MVSLSKNSPFPAFSIIIATPLGPAPQLSPPRHKKPAE